MNTDELDAIRARVDAATPGEWTSTLYPAVVGFRHYMVYSESGQNIADCGWQASRRSEENAVFIAHAPADIRALLAEVDRLTGERDQSRNLLVSARTIIDEQARQIEALVIELAHQQRRAVEVNTSAGQEEA